MSLILFDYLCTTCGDEFEELVEREHPDPVKCPTCGSSSTRRLVTGTRIDPRLGIHADVFSTMGDKWAKKQRQRKAIEMKRRREHGDE
jgi:putative FmdB family regulatory protein